MCQHYRPSVQPIEYCMLRCRAVAGWPWGMTQNAITSWSGTGSLLELSYLGWSALSMLQCLWNTYIRTRAAFRGVRGGLRPLPKWALPPLDFSLDFIQVHWLDIESTCISSLASKRIDYTKIDYTQACASIYIRTNFEWHTQKIKIPRQYVYTSTCMYMYTCTLYISMHTCMLYHRIHMYIFLHEDHQSTCNY